MEKENTFKVPKNFKIQPEYLNFITKDSAQHYKMVPLYFKDNKLTVGSLNPEDIEVREVLKFIGVHSNIDYEIKKINQEDFDFLIKQYENTQHIVDETLKKFDLENVEEQTDVEEIVDVEGGSGASEQNSTIINVVSSIIKKAAEIHASDIHIEPRLEKSSVRYRIDGILEEVTQFPKKVHAPIIARIKILSKLRLDETRRPQDGSFSANIKNNRIDFRVATLPTTEGEKVVLRVLDKSVGIRDLGESGFLSEDIEKIKKAMKLPYGLILVTGPTGSGKTTTLYSILNNLDKKSKNIVSLEDPVEYRVDGMFQSEIRSELGYNFATGLRSILRCDPNIILVGEIRDAETAKLAVQSALTGHLVFSTVHTNNAANTISRMIEFGVDPFLLAPTLSLVIGVRLVRTLYNKTGEPIPIIEAMQKEIEKRLETVPENIKKEVLPAKQFYKPKSIEEKLDGLKGRTIVSEVMSINDTLRTFILEGKNDLDIAAQAQKDGMVTMYQDALIKGLKGIIPIEEVNKMSVKADEDLTEDMFTKKIDDKVQKL